jgi:hypothetical protein
MLFLECARIAKRPHLPGRMLTHTMLRRLLKVRESVQYGPLASITLKGSRRTAAIASHVATTLPPISMRNARLSINCASKCASVRYRHSQT